MGLCKYLCAALFGIPLCLALLHVVLLAPPTPGSDKLRAAEKALKVQTMGRVRMYHVKSLRSLRDFSTVFHTLGGRAKYVNTNLEGEYRVQRLNLGVWGQVAAWVLGDDNKKRTLPWTGQRFVPSTSMTDAWGDNTYTRTTSGQQSRSASFFVNYDEASHVDGGPGSIVLDYGSHGGNGRNPTSFLVGELRCFNQHLCLGLTGYWFTGGPRNGIPYVLYREGTVSADETPPKVRYVPPTDDQDLNKPTKMKKKRIERKEKIYGKKKGRGDL